MTDELIQATSDEILKEKLQANVEIVCQDSLEERINAIDYLNDELKKSTSSMTSVPKPMKYLLPSLSKLKLAYETFTNDEYRKKLADLLSLLCIVEIEKNYDILSYRLACPIENIGCWGHEYVRCLTLVLVRAKEHPNEFPEYDQLPQLIEQISKYYMEHNDEPDACDLLLQVDRLEDIIDLVDEESHKRVCTYLLQNFNYLPDPLNTNVLVIVEQIYMKLGKTAQAMVIALKLNNREMMHEIFSQCTDPSIKKQLAFLLARQLIVFEDEMDEQIVNIATNIELFSRFTEVSKRLGKSKPKTPDDVLQSQSDLGNTRPSNRGDKNLSKIAKSFVGAFHNAGIKEDLYYTAPRGVDCINRNQGIGRAVAIATLGMLNLWDIETGLNVIEAWTHNDDDYYIMGALTGVGIVSAAVRSEFDPANALLGDFLKHKKEDVKIGAIFGFAMAYAGSAREDIFDSLQPLLEVDEPRVKAFASLAIGLIFVGTCNENALTAISQMIMRSNDDSMSIAQYIPIISLGFGLIFLGQQRNCEPALDLLQSIDEPDKPNTLSSFALTTVSGCAFAGTGSVEQIQLMLRICAGEDSMQHAAAVLSIAIIALGDPVSTQMANRMFEHIMQYGKSNARQMVPIALALTSVSLPTQEIVDTLHRYAHDVQEMKIVHNAIIALGLVAAGTQNTRTINILKQLEKFHISNDQAKMLCQISVGLTHLGQGLMTLSPTYGDSILIHPVALGSLMTIAFSCIAPLQHGNDNEKADPLILKEILLFFFVAPAIGQRFLVTLDEDLNIFPLQVRVGKAIDVVGQAGKPRTITGFQTLDTPVVLSSEQRAEFDDKTYEPLSPILEGFVIVRKRTEQKSE